MRCPSYYRYINHTFLYVVYCVLSWATHLIAKRSENIPYWYKNACETTSSKQILYYEMYDCLMKYSVVMWRAHCFDLLFIAKVNSKNYCWSKVNDKICTLYDISQCTNDHIFENSVLLLFLCIFEVHLVMPV